MDFEGSNAETRSFVIIYAKDSKHSFLATWQTRIDPAHLDAYGSCASRVFFLPSSGYPMLAAEPFSYPFDLRKAGADDRHLPVGKSNKVHWFTGNTAKSQNNRHLLNLPFSGWQIRGKGRTKKGQRAGRDINNSTLVHTGEPQASQVLKIREKKRERGRGGKKNSGRDINNSTLVHPWWNKWTVGSEYLGNIFFRFTSSLLFFSQLTFFSALSCQQHN